MYPTPPTSTSTWFGRLSVNRPRSCPIIEDEYSAAAHRCQRTDADLFDAWLTAPRGREEMPPLRDASFLQRLLLPSYRRWSSCAGPRRAVVKLSQFPGGRSLPP